MVLLLDGIPLSNHHETISLNEIYSHSPRLRESARRLTSRPPITVQPQGVIYVRQKGFSISFPGELLSDNTRAASIGTEDVLTCHVIVINYDRITALGHFDEYVTPKILDSFLGKFEDKVKRYFNEYQDYWDEGDWEWEEVDGDTDWNEEPEDDTNFNFQMNPISLRILGGYSDEAGKAERLRKRIFTYFQSHSYRFNLDEMILGDMNTKNGMYRKEPIIGGICCDLKTGKLFNAAFSSRAFLNELSDKMVNTLLLGPSLIKKPNALKRIILQKEDQGYSI
ncbi:protein N-terminal asparagine amidohydrolase [Lepeophtheirus salmonis]|nr:uncharacterized protein LOC121130179 [Lepeophtheirus salmonis]